MKVLSLFSGIGAFEKALTNMGVKYELVNYCEIDKYASKSYAAIHGVSESKNLGDITKVDTSKLPDDIDLITYGFPCQDISLAGRQRGFEHEGERTRSGLFFEALRLIEDLQPKFAICENVKNLTSKKFANEFQIVLESLEEAGYKNYWQVLNAKDYGIPQNRERVFIVSIREDIDKGFNFPEPYELELRLKDMLDDEVDEKYYLSDKAINYVCATGTKSFYYKPEIDLEVARPLTSTMHKSHRASQDTYISDEFIKNDNKVDIVDGKPEIIKLGNFSKKKTQSRSVYDSAGISPTLCAGMDHSNTMPHITVRDDITLQVKDPFIVASRGRNPENPSDRTAGAPTVQRLEPNKQGICNTLTTVQKDNLVAQIVENDE